MSPEIKALWKETATFHRHECPGLAIGFRMALQVKSVFKLEGASQDEELVCVTETDACGVDAVQYVLGCSFGKGNLIYKPRGKMTMTFYLRKSQQSARFIFIGSLLQGWREASREERQEKILSLSFHELYKATMTHHEILPEKARLLDSYPCSQCGELTAEPMMVPFDGKLWCRECRPFSIHAIKS